MEYFRRLRPWVFVVLAIIAIDGAWLLLTPHSLAPEMIPQLYTIALVATWLAGLSYLLRDRMRLAILVSGLTLILVSWPALRLFNHLMMTLVFPLQDATLASWDMALGLDWIAYVHWVDSQPLLVDLILVLYTGLTGYSCALYLILILGRDPMKACEELIGLFLTTAIVCTTIGIFMPAFGAMTYFAPPDGTFTHFTSETGGYAVQATLDRRSGLPQVFDLAALPGLTTFPSFHTAMGVIAIYCARRTPWLFVPMLVANVIMIMGTPVAGAHYFVDVMAGTLVVMAIAYLLQRFEKRREIADLPSISGVGGRGGPVTGEHPLPA